MTGVLWPASRTRETISGTAAADSLLLTVTRTSSDPAWASSMTCRAVAIASAVSVLVIDCTTTALQPPMRAPPTLTDTEFLRLIFAMRPSIDRRPRIRPHEDIIDYGKNGKDGTNGGALGFPYFPYFPFILYSHASCWPPPHQPPIADPILRARPDYAATGH